MRLYSRKDVVRMESKVKRIKIFIIVFVILFLVTAGICYVVIPKKCGLKKGCGYNPSEVLQKATDYVEEIKPNEETGKFISVSESYACGIKQMGKLYAQAQVKALYDNYDIMYTIVFDKKMNVVETYKKIIK